MGSIRNIPAKYIERYPIESTSTIPRTGKFIISGPCVLEDYDTSLEIATFVENLCITFPNTISEI